MQRVDPRPVEPSSQQQGQEGQKQWTLPTAFASTGAQPHTQSFEEIYGVPENFLEIEVRSPIHDRWPLSTALLIDVKN